MKLLKWLTLLLVLFFLSCSGEPETNQENIENEPEVEKDSLTLNYDSIAKKHFHYTDLSNVFDYKLEFTRMFNVDGGGDSSEIRIFIIDKKTKKEVDNIEYSTMFYFGDVFTDSKNVRSLITGKNRDLEIIDGDFGDLIIVDFNFDRKEDLAILNDSGGNAGPLYNYYIQTNNHHFVLDKFLTDSVVFFPIKIDAPTMTLTTEVVSGACGFTKSIFTYQRESKSWKRKSSKYIDVCD